MPWLTHLYRPTIGAWYAHWLLSTYMKTLFDLEREGRELATELQTRSARPAKVPVAPRDLVEKLLDRLSQLSEYVRRGLENIEEPVVGTESFFELLEEFESFLTKIRDAEKEGWVFDGDVASAIKRYVDEIREALPIDYAYVGDEEYVDLYGFVSENIEPLAEKLASHIVYRRVDTRVDPEAAARIAKYLEEVGGGLATAVSKIHEEIGRILEKHGWTPEKGASYEYCRRMPECWREVKPLIDLLEAAQTIEDIVREVGAFIRVQKHNGARAFRVEERISVVEPVYANETKTIRGKFERLAKLLGRRYVGMMVHLKPELSWAAIVNDIANAVHILAEELTRRGIEAKFATIGKKVDVLIEPHPLLEKLAKLWDEITEEYYRRGLYLAEDYSALYGTLEGNELSLRVGSAAGHATHVVVEDNTLRLRYYDADYSVNMRIKQELEACGCECKLVEDGVECVCRNVSSDALECIARTIASATSMDIRGG